MKKNKFTEKQIIGFLKQIETRLPVLDICRQVGLNTTTFYKWPVMYGVMEASDAKCLNKLESENAQLKKLQAEAHLDIEALKVGFGVKR